MQYEYKVVDAIEPVDLEETLNKNGIAGWKLVDSRYDSFYTWYTCVFESNRMG